MSHNTVAEEGRRNFTPVGLGRQRTRLITLEEHAVIPVPLGIKSSTLNLFDSEFVAGLEHRLQDIALRVRIMDANNIGAQIISLNQPTAQAIVDSDTAVQFCRRANQYVYEHYCKQYPGRFFGFATLPTTNAEAAAAELQRCVTEYGFVGAMINGYTNTADPAKALYLDHPQYDVLWAVATRLKKPVFIHPRVPLQSNLNNIDDIPALHGAPYGFARETVEHVFRLMYNGVFDRFPDLQICLGHMGEGLSWILPRSDTTFRMYSSQAQGPKKRKFQEYFQKNILPNTSGMPRTSALLNLLAEADPKNITFSVDYPYESISEMRDWFETVPISDELWKDIGYRNAIRLFKLPLNYDGN